jgi:hypothetical protein
VTTAKFFGAMSKSCGQDLTPFMNQWFVSDAVPVVTETRAATARVFRQSAPAVAFTPEAWFWTGRGWVRHRLNFSPDRPEISVPVSASLASAPAFIDPEGHWALGSLAMPEVPVTERAAVFNALPTFTKVRYVGHLAGIPAANLAALVSAPGNRVLVTSLLGTAGRDSADLLVRMGTNPIARVRVAAVNRLRDLYPSAMPTTVRTFLSRVAKDDANATVRSLAYVAVMRAGLDPALADRAWTMDVYNEGYRIGALRWWLAHDRNRARSAALAALDTPMTEPVQLEAMAVLGRLGDLPGSTAIHDRLVAILATPAYSERISALRALTEMGDVAAIPAIAPVADEKLSFIRNAAKVALASLRAKAVAPRR